MEVMKAVMTVCAACVGVVIVLAIGVDIYDRASAAWNRRRAGR